MLFLRIFQHLLPRSEPWKLTIDKTLRRFFEGLAAGIADPARLFIDQVHEDLFPDTTRELERWQKEFGLGPSSDEATQRLALAAEWRATGGQSPDYFEQVLQTAGFDLYVFDWWSSGPPYVARDPRSYTTQPLIGTVQCSAFANQRQCQAENTLAQPQCDRFLANEPGYLVNKDLTRQAPPPVPNDPKFWPFFIYVGASSFGTRAEVSSSRRAELERLVLKLRPTQLWIVMLVDYIGDDFYVTRDGLSRYTTRDGVSYYRTR